MSSKYDDRLRNVDLVAHNYLNLIVTKEYDQSLLDALYVEINRIDGLKISIFDRGEEWNDRRIDRLTDIIQQVGSIGEKINALGPKFVAVLAPPEQIVTVVPEIIKDSVPTRLYLDKPQVTPIVEPLPVISNGDYHILPYPYPNATEPINVSKPNYLNYALIIGATALLSYLMVRKK